MNRRDQGETDAIVRRLRGFARVFENPPDERVNDPEQVRVRMGWLICEGFVDLDRRLRSGEPLPEVWDVRVGFKYRERHHGASSYRYTYSPGCSVANVCHVCDWIDPAAVESACRRCHTIRERLPNAIEGC